jgi:hypothetical protein
MSSSDEELPLAIRDVPGCHKTLHNASSKAMVGFQITHSRLESLKGLAVAAAT